MKKNEAEVCLFSGKVTLVSRLDGFASEERQSYPIDRKELNFVQSGFSSGAFYV